MNAPSRRAFLKGTAATGFATGIGWAPFARAAGANGDIRIGVVGVGSSVKIGGKGKQDLRKFRNYPGVRIVALCDVDRRILDAEVAECAKHHEKVAAYTDVRALLDDKDVDAIIVTTPNHWHSLATVWACQAGKDAYVEKPASHNIFEGRKMVEAARKYERIVQCTNNSRSPTGFREALAWVRAGNIGKIRSVRGLNYKPRQSIGRVDGPQPIPREVDYDLWTGPAPMAPLMRKNLHYDWHWDWRYGDGDLGNMGIHFIDGCRMAVGAGGLPRRVLSIGGRFGYDDDGETPNTQLIFLDYEEAPVLFEVRGLPRDKAAWPENWDRNMDRFHGIGMGVVVLCEGGYQVNNKVFDAEGKLIMEFSPATEEVGANFLAAVRSRRATELVADIEEGHLSAALVHMGNISHRLGAGKAAGEIRERIEGNRELADAYGRFAEHLAANGIDLDTAPATLGPMLTMDPASERFTGEFSEAANALARPAYREPFVVPEEV